MYKHLYVTGYPPSQARAGKVWLVELTGLT